MGNATRKKINKLSLYNLFCVIIFIIILIQPISILYTQRDKFFSKGYQAQYNSFNKAYLTSQYVQKKEPGIIPDETLESFAGGAFLRGVNPILIVHDQPPLGRYLISLSIFVFDNANTITVAVLILSSIGIFLVGRTVLGNLLLALIPLGIFINEPLFLSKFEYSPLLEPIQLPFIIFALYFFIKGITQKTYGKWFVLVSIMLGFVISVRYFILGLSLLAAMFIYFLLRKRIDKKLTLFILTLPISLIILTLSYIKTIQSGASIIHVFGIQKYLFLYHKSAFILPFSFWDLLLFNRWHTWWGTMAISHDTSWFIAWPFAMVLSEMSLIFSLLKKINLSKPEKILILWVAMYSSMLSAGYTSTRYFLPLIPFLYILAVSFIVKLSKALLTNKK